MDPPDGEIDSVFDKQMLDQVYEKVSPCVVAILLDPTVTGYIVKTNNTHNLIIVYPPLLGIGSHKRKITIRYSDGVTGMVDRIERLSSRFSVLHSPHLGNPRQTVKFGELQDIDCQKIVTVFPYKNDLMLCKGHITFADCTSEDRRGEIVPGGEKLFMFTCPVAGSYALDPKVNYLKRLAYWRLVVGAPVFDLDGFVIGRIFREGAAHHMKFAEKSSCFRADLNTLEPLDWQDEKEKEKKHKATDLSSSDEEREPTPTAMKAKKEKKDKKKGKTDAKEKVNDNGKRTATCEDDLADRNALSSFQISDSMKQKLKSNGINAMFPIRAFTSRLILDGNDLVGHACPGQGKTLAFVIPILESLCNGPHKATRRTDYGRPPSVLVLLPTRELADQVHADFKFYGGAFGLSTCCAYEGSHYCPQEIAMTKGVDVIVGTPGRVKDFIVKGSLSLKCLKFCVLDEADEMLNMGFAEDVELILGKVEDVTKVQTLLFSATLSEWVKKLSMRFLKAEKRTVDLVGNEKRKASVSVRHLALPCNHAARSQIVPGIIRCYSHGGQTIIFTKTKKSASELSGLIPGSRALHGDITQAEREVLLADFRSGKFFVLVATNVAAQGLDINDVHLIIQCEAPRDGEAYIYQSGWTGRAGNTGFAVTLFEPKDKFCVRRIERKFGVKFEQISTMQPTDLVQSAGNEAVDAIAGAAAMVTLDGVKQLPALQERDQSRGNSGRWRFGSEAADAIASVSDSVIPVFRQQAEELLSSSNMSAVDLLAKALANAVGYIDIKKRSLLSSVDNCTTLRLTTGSRMYTPTHVLSTLKRFMPEDRVSNVQGVVLTSDGRGAVFDVPSAEVQDYFQGAENAAGVTLDEVKELPALQEREQQSRGGGGDGRAGFNTGGGRRFGWR